MLIADSSDMASYQGHFTRRKIKERRKAFRKHWPLVAAVALPMCVLAAVFVQWAVADQGLPVWTLGPVVVVAMLWASRSQLDGTYHLESSIEAEGWTSKDFKKALGRGWHVVDHISFGELGDVDHVVIGPAGIFVIETKYTDSNLDFRKGQQIVWGWIDQAQMNTRRVRLLLKHNYSIEVEPSPLVVVSGTEFLRLPADVEDVVVVRRRNLRKRTSAWRATGQILSSEQIESIRASLLDYCRIREALERHRAA